MSQVAHSVDTEILAPIAPLDPQIFRDRFGRGPFKIEHNLVQHHLFELPRLMELAQSLPENRVEYNAGDLPVSQDPNLTPRNGLSPEETIQRIQDCRSWLVLKNVEIDAEYRALLDACLSVIGEQSELIDPGMCKREAFIFVSSPGSVTPYHIDPENNFLLQIRGRKTVTMFDAMDRAVLTEQQLENFYVGAHRNLHFEDSFNIHGQAFELLPGQGLHFPVAAPHWVQNGSEVSVSFSITFRTNDSERRESLYRFNHRLRKWGLKPRQVGASACMDNFKYSLAKTFQCTKRMFGRGQTRPYYGTPDVQ